MSLDGMVQVRTSSLPISTTFFAVVVSSSVPTTAYFLATVFSTRFSAVPENDLGLCLSEVLLSFVSVLSRSLLSCSVKERARLTEPAIRFRGDAFAETQHHA